jgi:DMSO/TMAO reductase YedYZ molybdopterin-dependent catalytic subunit
MYKKFRLTFIIVAMLVITFIPASAVAEPSKLTILSNGIYDFTYQQLVEMPKTTVYAELYCDGSLLTAANWSGVQISYLLNQLNASADVNSIQFVASDGYTIAMPIQLAQLPQTIIAYQINGQPLPEGLRLILPGYNGAAWISQIVSISTSYNVVAAPLSISVGSVSQGVLNDYGKRTTPMQTVTSATPSAKPEQKPTTAIPSPNPSVLTANNTEVEPTHSQQTVGQQSTGLKQMSIAVVVSVIIVGLAAAILVYCHRNKLKATSAL